MPEVEALITDAISSSPWEDAHLIAADVMNALLEGNWLQAPEGWQEPTDEELQQQADEALAEWRRSS